MFCMNADVAQLVEHFLGKEEVDGSIPFISSSHVYLDDYGCSSIGRATVSKTVGCGFESYRPCYGQHSHRKLMIAKIKQYSGEVSKEMKKVSWPSKQQLKESTIVVIVTCLLISTFVWIIDFLMTSFIQTIF